MGFPTSQLVFSRISSTNSIDIAETRRFFNPHARVHLAAIVKLAAPYHWEFNLAGRFVNSTHHEFAGCRFEKNLLT